MTTTFEPILEPARTYPAVAAADAALRASNWPAVWSAFGGAGAYERHQIVQLADKVDGSEGYLGSLVQANPGDLLAATMLARREVGLAWQLRGNGRASTVDPKVWDGFRSHVRRAEQLLIRACAQDPGFVPAWRVRLLTARGLDLGPVESRRRYDRLERHSPNDLLAQEGLLQNIVPKWRGTWDAAHSFVWACANAAPPGSPNASVVVTYHQERWLDSGRKAGEVFAEPQVRQEIWSAGELSVMNPAFTTAPGWVFALSQFAFAYGLMQDWARAKSCFTRLGPYASGWGWEYLNKDPLTPFNELRQKAMERG